MVKKLKTKKYKRMKFINILLIIITITYFCIIFGLLSKDIFFILKLFGTTFYYYILYVMHMTSFLGFLNITIFFALFYLAFIPVIILLSFPVNIICLFIKNKISTKINASIFYEDNLDITYIRDTFKGISPGEASVVIDYEIENKKDITAILMKLYLKKYIDFKDNKIVVENHSLANLDASEKYVLEKLMKNEYYSISNRKLYEIAIDEAVNHGFIKKKTSDKKLLIKLFCIIALFIGLCFINGDLDKLSQEQEAILEVIEKKEIANDENLGWEAINQIVNDADFNEMMSLTSSMVIILLAKVMRIVLPIYAVICIINYKSSKMKYKRTKRGNELVQLLKGLKSFIKDFSLLADKNKEEINMWEDFLIYAIVLEENEKIIKDIMSYKKIDVNKIDNSNFIHY